MGILNRISLLLTVMSSMALAESDKQCIGDDCWTASSMLQKRKEVGKVPGSQHDMEDNLVKEAQADEQEDLLEKEDESAALADSTASRDATHPGQQSDTDEFGFDAEDQKEESMLQSASGDPPPFAKAICQPSGILTPNECCPNGYEAILNLEICRKALNKIGPVEFDPEIKTGPHMGRQREVNGNLLAMHIEGTKRPQWSQMTWGSRHFLKPGDAGYNGTHLPTAGRGCGVWPRNNVGIFTPYDQVGKEVNGVIWPLCVISTYPKDEMPEFAISHCRPSGKYTKNECCDYGYVEITEAEHCERGLDAFPFDCGRNCGIQPAEWKGESQDDNYPFGCYIRNHDRAGPISAGYRLQGRLNTKTPQGDMVSGRLGAATVCRRLDYGFEGEYYAPRNPEVPSDSKADFVICTIKQGGTVVNVDCPGIPSMSKKTGSIPEPKLLSIEGMTARRFGNALRFSNGWVWNHKKNDAALQDSR